MSLVMLTDHVAVIPLEDPIYREESGLWLAEQTRQRVDQGIIKYRGPATVDLRVGDHVFFQAYCGTKMTVEGEGTFIILSEEDVDAVWNEPPQKMFPQSLVDRLLSEAKGEAIIKVGESPGRVVETAIDYVFEIVQTKFNDYEAEKGLEF